MNWEHHADGEAESLRARCAELEYEVRRLREEVTANEHARPEFERLLLVIHPTGFIEVFGEKWHQVHVVNLPRVPPEQEVQAEQMECDRLPNSYQHLWFPSKCRAMGNVNQCLSIPELIWHLEQHETIKALDHATADPTTS